MNEQVGSSQIRPFLLFLVPVLLLLLLLLLFLFACRLHLLGVGVGVGVAVACSAIGYAKQRVIEWICEAMRQSLSGYAKQRVIQLCVIHSVSKSDMRSNASLSYASFIQSKCEVMRH